MGEHKGFACEHRADTATLALKPRSPDPESVRLLCEFMLGNTAMWLTAQILELGCLGSISSQHLCNLGEVI